MFTLTKEAHAMHNFIFISLFLLMCVAAMAAAFSAMMQFYGWAFFALFNMVACSYAMHKINCIIHRPRG